MNNQTVEHNVTAFRASLAGKTKQRLVLQVAPLVKLLTPAAIAENLVEKIEECPLNRHHYVLFGYS